LDLVKSGADPEETLEAGYESKLVLTLNSGEDNRTVETGYFSRPIQLRFILLLALAVHGPLLALQLPLTNSYDANFHVFFASHYALHWFAPGNP
jgi:hypothetical protein